MITTKKIRVLIVDDSFVLRETIARGISVDSGIEVVGTAMDAFDAKDKVIALQPDVITLDIEMPKKNGIVFLKELMLQYPTPTVVVSSVSEYTFDALNAGAVDFVVKPDRTDLALINRFFNELIVKIKIAYTAKIGLYKSQPAFPASSTLSAKLTHQFKERLIVIGASTGGTEAVACILSQFRQELPGVLIVQHMPPVFTKMFANRLNNACPMEVKEAQNGDKVIPGRVLIAPGDFHMQVKYLQGEYHVECFHGENVNGHCPSVGVLFDSVAKYAAKNTIGIILTGMGDDGAEGLLAMRKNGARTIGQNEESCVVYGMPKVAFDIGAVEEQASLHNIPALVMKWLE